MKPTHWFTLASNTVALVCLTIVLVVREDIDPGLLLTIFAVIATGVPIGTSAVNGWRERLTESQRRESDTQRIRRLLREELPNTNPGVKPDPKEG